MTPRFQTAKHGETMLAQRQVSDTGPTPFSVARRQLAATVTGIERTWADQTIVGVLLEDVRRPTADARAGYEVREQIQRKAQVIQHQGRIIIDIGNDALGLPHALLHCG